MNSPTPEPHAHDAEATPATAADSEAPHGLIIGAQTVLLALSALIAWNSLDLGLFVTLGPGAGFFPFFLSIGLFLLAFAWFIQTQRSWAKERQERTTRSLHTAAFDMVEDTSRSIADLAQQSDADAQETSSEELEASRLARKHVINIILSLIVLAIVIVPLGYQIPMFLFLVYHLGFRARRRWYTVLLIALAGSIGVFHIFNDLLSVALPYSSFEFLNLIGL